MVVVLNSQWRTDVEINIRNVQFLFLYNYIIYIILIHTLSLSLIPSSVRVPDSLHLNLTAGRNSRFITLVALYILIYLKIYMKLYSGEIFLPVKQISDLKLNFMFWCQQVLNLCLILQEQESTASSLIVNICNLSLTIIFKTTSIIAPKTTWLLQCWPCWRRANWTFVVRLMLGLV